MLCGSVDAIAQDTIQTFRSQKGKSGTAGDFGTAVERIADVDGDGICDVLVGAPTEDPVRKFRQDGVVYVLSTATGNVLQRYNGPANGQMGTAISSGDDFDGDGTMDFVTSVPGSSTIRVYSVKSGTLLYVRSGDAGGAMFGDSVFCVDDVDGDLVGDFGATGAVQSSPGIFTNVLYVYSGRTGKLVYKSTATSSGSPSVELYRSPTGLPDLNGDGLAEIAVAADDPTNGWEVDVIDGATGKLVYTIANPGGGPTFGDHLGRIGDLDGDGLDDLAAADSSYNANAALPLNGRVYALSSATGVEIFHWDGQNAFEHLGVLARNGVFDFNGDHVPDIVIGSPNPPQSPPPLHNAGWTYVYSGATGALLYRFTGSEYGGEGEALGTSVTPVGDVDGDRVDDLLVGGPAYQDKSYAFGQAYVFKGNDLFLESDKSVYMAGDNIEIDTRGGVPYATELLAAIDVNGAAQFTVVDLEFLDQNGDYALIDTVPSGLQGLDVTFQAFATRPPKKGLADSSTITLSFQ
jgi:hypothetical protein